MVRDFYRFKKIGSAMSWSSVHSNRPLIAGLIAATACVSASLYIRSAIQYKDQSKGTAVAKSRSRLGDSGKLVLPSAEDPYPPNVFPGGRDVDTPFGMIKVFEWGPEDGEKVLLMHGIGTPCVALGDAAKHLVSKGYRVMLFDFFGRGYSDAPTDLPYDDRLYSSQILSVLASSPLSWTGNEAFHILGYSLGGAIAAAFTTYFPHMLRSSTLICPGGLIRTSHLSLKSRVMYSEGIFPDWLLHRIIRRRLEPQHGPSADVPVDEDYANIDFDEVPLSKQRRSPRVKDAMRWQLQGNEGLVGAYLSTIRKAPIYGQHEGLWRKLSQRLAERRIPGKTVPGLPGGKICLILAEKDPVAVPSEWEEDSREVLGEDGFDMHVVPGGHEIAISKGAAVADLAIHSWEKNIDRRQ